MSPSTKAPTLRKLAYVFAFLLLLLHNGVLSSYPPGLSVAYAGPQAEIGCNRPSAFVINLSSQPIWVLYTVLKQGSITECIYDSKTIGIRKESDKLADPEAIWVRCPANEAGCRNGLRVFKLGDCYFVSCIAIKDSGLSLAVYGDTTCASKCGWIDGTDMTAWPPDWDSRRPPGGAVVYSSLDTSNWTCHPTEKCLLNRPAVCPSISGWKGEYWNSVDQTFNGPPTLCRNEPEINFDWGTGGPGGGLSNDNFTARWTRRINFNAGSYTFTATADDGIRVYIDDNRIIDEWRGQPPSTFQRTISLAGGDHTIKVEYFEGGGGAIARVSWQQAGQSGCPPITAWKGEYWSGYFNDPPAVCRNDNDLNFDWGTGSPDPRIPSDNFTARWTRPLNFAAGRYRFHLAGDDGFSLRVDDRVVIDKWINQPRTEYTGEIDLSAGSHALKVEYFEAGGGANITLWWDGPLAPPPPTGGSPIDPNKIYRIIAVHSGKGLDVNGASPNDGAQVQQWAYGGGANQKWRFEPTGDGYYMIRALHSNKCLDVDGASPNNGARVQQWTCAGANNQRWQVSADGNAFVIRVKHSGKALDVAGASQDNGAPVHQWDYGGGANQRWRIEVVQ